MRQVLAVSGRLSRMKRPELMPASAPPERANEPAGQVQSTTVLEPGMKAHGGPIALPATVMAISPPAMAPGARAAAVSAVVALAAGAASRAEGAVVGRGGVGDRSQLAPPAHHLTVDGDLGPQVGPGVHRRRAVVAEGHP